MTLGFLLWLVVGALLVITELMTGTFYLLIFGIAAWAGAAVNYAGYQLNAQLVVAGVAALVGLTVVRYLKRRHPFVAADDGDLDIGNDVTVESIVNASRLKVQYRGSTWDAVPESGSTTTFKAGDTAIIRAVRGNVLVVQAP